MSSSAGLNYQPVHTEQSFRAHMDIKWRVGFTRLWNDGKGGVCR